MGDRTWCYLPCPQCGAETEQFDAPSSLIWAWNCDACGWSDKRSYFEVDDHPMTIELMTDEEARERGILMDCPECKGLMVIFEKKYWGKCWQCDQANGSESEAEVAT